MNKAMRIALVLLAVGAASVHAQEAGRARVVRPRSMDAARGLIEVRAGFGSVERMLRLRDTLNLSDAQVTQLEAIRKEQVARRQQEAIARIDLESRAAAGMLEREALRDQLDDRADQAEEFFEQTRDRIEKVLTEQQRQQLRDFREHGLRMRVPGPGFDELRARELIERVPRIRGDLLNEFEPLGGGLFRYDRALVMPNRWRGFF